MLSFLNNQSLTKMQMITGDQYPRCESHLVQYCCSCEEDKPVINDGLCSDCDAAKGPNYKPKITKTEAKDWYGIVHFAGIPCDVRKYYTLYKRVDLDRHMMRLHGTRLNWVRAIAKKDSRLSKLRATKEKKKQEYEAYLSTLPKGFKAYVQEVSSKVMTKEDLKACAKRFKTISAALNARGLKLRMDSKLCQEYIMAGRRIVDSIVDTMEEMSFLFTHTSYSNRCDNEFNAFREDPFEREWYPRDEYRETMQSLREDVKRELCVEYLDDNMGLTLPRKWERCRSRYDNVVSSGASPHKFVYHIYTGGGRGPKPNNSLSAPARAY